MKQDFTTWTIEELECELDMVRFDLSEARRYREIDMVEKLDIYADELGKELSAREADYQCDR
jgi:hypothetical protein